MVDAIAEPQSLDFRPFVNFILSSSYSKFMHAFICGSFVIEGIVGWLFGYCCCKGLRQI